MSNAKRNRNGPFPNACAVYPRNCAHCDKLFIGRRSTTVTCPECRSTLPRSGRPRTCEVCSAAYMPTYPAQRTCGRACGAELQRRNCAEDGKGYAGRLPGRTCKRCGKRSTSVTVKGAVCDDCRAPVVRTCDVCGASFMTTIGNRKRKRCSEECGYLAIKRNIIDRYHSEAAFRDRVITASQNRRADKIGGLQITSHAQLLGYLIKRDRGRCGICRKLVRAEKGPMRPSIDHIVPLSKGGTHELANVQLAHYRCNLSKKDRGHGEQLLLLG